jgi:hypothetical protein
MIQESTNDAFRAEMLQAPSLKFGQRNPVVAFFSGYPSKESFLGPDYQQYSLQYSIKLLFLILKNREIL